MSSLIDLSQVVSSKHMYTEATADGLRQLYVYIHSMCAFVCAYVCVCACVCAHACACVCVSNKTD